MQLTRAKCPRSVSSKPAIVDSLNSGVVLRSSWENLYFEAVEVKDHPLARTI